MVLLNIEGVDMPNPTSYQVGVKDLDSESSVRSESGLLHRDRIRAGVRTIEVGWTVKTEDISKILKASAKESVTVKFFDPEDNAIRTSEMYAGDRVPVLKVLTDNSGATSAWWDLSFTLTEF